ncbi:MAG: hypothetical protein K5694_01790 [Bacilli bacterium]|nr:hypothetical protein [Bacilli bacterium]
MNKASRILLLVGSILAAVAAVTYIILGIVFIATSAEVVKYLVQQGQATSETAQGVLAAYIALFFIFGVLSIPAAIFGFLLPRRYTRGFAIATLAVAVAAGANVPLLLGAIFAIIVSSRKPAKA